MVCLKKDAVMKAYPKMIST